MASSEEWGLRDYGQDTKTVWDADPSCKHEWGKEITEKHCGGTGASIVTNNSDDRIHFVSKSNFCSKCGAWKGQLGLEPTFDLYVRHLCDIFDEVRRVLKDTGTVWINLGDTYSGSGCGTNDYRTEASRSIQGKGKNAKLYKTGGIAQKVREVPAKSLCLIPFRFAIEMVSRGWIMRNLIVWHKPNCIPSSAKDRFTVDFELIMFFVKNRKYFFEQQFEPYINPLNRWGGSSLKSDTSKTKEYKRVLKIGYSSCFRVGREMRPHALGRNKRCVWRIPTQPFSEAHFAVFPDTLVETPIKAGCPKQVCKRCGKPRRNILKQEVSLGTKFSQTKYDMKTYTAGRLAQRRQAYREFGYENSSAPIIVGCTDCGCGVGFEPGIVLDPFCGSGTTCVVAKKLGHNWIGIDIHPEYCKMARRRLAKAL